MAEDPDAAENITYAFVKDILPFAIDTFTGVISPEGFLDRETEAVYSTTVEVNCECNTLSAVAFHALCILSGNTFCMCTMNCLYNEYA